MSYSFPQALLARLIASGRQVEILETADIGPSSYAVTVRGTWYGRPLIRCFVVIKLSGQWQTREIPLDWVTRTAQHSLPPLPPPHE
jgi:hypothetical protein